MNVELLLEFEDANINDIMQSVDSIKLLIDNLDIIVKNIKYNIEENLVNIVGNIEQHIIPKNLKVVNSIYLLADTDKTHLDFTYTLLTLKIDGIILYC